MLIQSEDVRPTRCRGPQLSALRETTTARCDETSCHLYPHPLIRCCCIQCNIGHLVASQCQHTVDRPDVNKAIRLLAVTHTPGPGETHAHRPRSSPVCRRGLAEQSGSAQATATIVRRPSRELVLPHLSNASEPLVSATPRLRAVLGGN